MVDLDKLKKEADELGGAWPRLDDAIQELRELRVRELGWMQSLTSLSEELSTLKKEGAMDITRPYGL